MRSKQDYILEANDKGKMSPKKVGLAPVQREGMEYEFTTVFDVAMNHEAIASKDRTSLFTDKIFKITEEIGSQLKGWLVGVEPTNKEKLTEVIGALSEQHQNVSRETLNAIYAYLKNEFVQDEDLENAVKAEFKKRGVTQ
jgi:hypothetical protein